MSTRAAAVTTPVLFVLAAIVITLGLTVACSGPQTGPEPGAGTIRLTETHTIGKSVVVGNLTVWPVFTDHPIDLGDFATLVEALTAGTVEIREVGGGGQQVSWTNDLSDEEIEQAEADDIPDIDVPEELEGRVGITNGNDFPLVQGQLRGGGAIVGTLVIENRGDIPLLVCAGTIVTGGNQDRQIGEDIIIQAKTAAPVEAFCVEQGRWAGNRMGDVTNGQFTGTTMNALKPVRMQGQYEKAQGEVWNEVAATKKQWCVAVEDVEIASISRAENARAVEGSSSLAVVLDASEEVSGKELDALREAVRGHFEKHGAGAVGFAYAVDGKVVSVRAFLNSKVFDSHFDPFLASMVAEAWIARKGKTEDASAPVAAKAEDVVALVAAVESADEKTLDTRGSNLNGIRMNDRGYNGNCYLPVEGKKVAVTRDWSSK